MKTILLFAASALIADPRLAGAEGALSVCAVWADLAKYHGETVVVRGPVVATGEGAWLSTSECKEDLITAGFTWPRGIWLEMGSSRHTAAEYQVMLDSTKRTRQILQSQAHNPAKDRLWMTITGRLFTRPDLKGRVDGFGHMNSAPAELLVLMQADPKIERGISVKR